MYKKNSCNEDQLLTVYKLWSLIHFYKAEFEPALDYSLKTLSLSQSNGKMQEEAEAMLMIAQLFARMGETQKGLSYCRAAIPVINKLKSSAGKVDLLNKIGSRYYFFFQDTKSASFFDSAVVFFNQARTLATQLQYTRGLQISYNKMNTLAFKKKDYILALSYLDSAIALSKSGESSEALATSYGDKGNIFLKMGNYDEARKWADSCLALNLRNKFQPLIANAYSLVAEIADSSRDYKTAYAALYSEKRITDSLNNADKIKAVAELERKYNQAKNEKTIKELSQQKQIYSLIAIAALLSVVIVAFYLRQQSLKHRQVILETEQRLNRARMNPHFFFNALASLQSFALRENDGKAIAVNLAKFSHIMRETLESTYREYVSLEQEIDFLHEYLSLQQIRFPEKFTYEVECAESIEKEDVMIPSMIVQPFVENSIEHGFSSIDYKGHVQIRFQEDRQQLIIRILDNGKGLPENPMQKDGHVSRASQIIKDRIYLLNFKLKTKASFSVNNVAQGKGVVVEIRLPLLHHSEIDTENSGNKSNFRY
jgi:sensor histidine kinase YesM